MGRKVLVFVFLIGVIITIKIGYFPKNLRTSPPPPRDLLPPDPGGGEEVEFLMMIYNFEKFEQWYRRGNHSELFQIGHAWTLLVTTSGPFDFPGLFSLLANQSRLTVQLCPLPEKFDVPRLSADFCFRYFVFNQTSDATIFFLMEMDVMVRNVPLFVSLVVSEAHAMATTPYNMVRTTMNLETQNRFCAFHLVKPYCTPFFNLLNGVALFHRPRLSTFGFLSQEMGVHFDVDLSAKLMTSGHYRQFVASPNHTLVCMLPLEDVFLVGKFLRGESCPAWHVFRFLERPELLFDSLVEKFMGR
jgi:hypothetical protein